MDDPHVFQQWGTGFGDIRFGIKANITTYEDNVGADLYIDDTPRNVAETELQAHRKHRDLLREEIQTLAGNCGWDPTDRQKADPTSVPSEMQMKEMEARGWKAFDALSSTPP